MSPTNVSTALAVPDPITGTILPPPSMTPSKGFEAIQKHLRTRYPSRLVWRKIQSTRWFVSCDKVTLETDTVALVKGVAPGHHNRCGCGATEDETFRVDVVAGTCTCPHGDENGSPCEHLFAAMIYVQVSALDRAWRATHEGTCRKHWCSRRAHVWHKLGLCWLHASEWRRMLERHELDRLRAVA